MPRPILSVSYDSRLLATRQQMLEQAGHDVTSALGFTKAIIYCKYPHSSSFDLFVLDQTIPASHKKELIRTFQCHCPAPVLSLTQIDEERVESDYYLNPDQHHRLLETVAEILAKLTSEPPP